MTPVLRDYFRTGLVPRFPTLIFACFVLTASLLSFGIALVLDAVKKQSDQSFESRILIPRTVTKCASCRFRDGSALRDVRAFWYNSPVWWTRKQGSGGRACLSEENTT